MIVHGHSSDRTKVEQILRDEGIIEPIVLQERLTAGKTVPEKFEREARQADGAVVLFTPDDQAWSSSLSAVGESVKMTELRVRARQNAILEYGWFWASWGRHRVLLIVKGDLELPSDLAGMLYQSYDADPGECKAAIASFIKQI
jgi:predicted nucleotide-binding protein